MSGVLFGAAYYHEYQPYERLDEDIRLMREAGFTCVRVGESTWSSWEPADGRFEFAWMDRVVDALHRAGIEVIVGTPTYAIPPWLHRTYPEIMAGLGQGRRAHYGGRQNMDLTHPAYRHYAERVIRAVVGHVAPHPAVIGFQVDNETGIEILHNPGVFQSFVDHLRATFGTVERLNELWGLTYWSQRLGAWSDLWAPDGNTNPGYNLEWRRFQARLVTEFLGWQAGIVREYTRPDQFITHNVVGGHSLSAPASDRHAIAGVVDVPAENAYHSTQDGLLLPPPAGRDPTNPSWIGDEGGVWALYRNGDLGRSGRQGNFLVTELNARSIGGSSSAYPAYDGQWRLAAYAYIARGAGALSYWHWHTLHYGHEAHWGGVLGHDLEPGRAYREIARIGHELERHGDLLTGLRVDADVAILHSRDSTYALAFQPPLALPGQQGPDRHAYQRIFDAFYRAFFDARAQAAVVHPAQEFERFPVLVAPALYVADEALLGRLVRYAEGGGHLLLTFRCGYADEHARARWRRAPGPLRAAVGASYQEYSNLASPLALRPGDGGLALPAGARAEAWADGLEVEGATPLAYYDHPHFGRFPALVSQPVGAGRVTYCGTLPNPALGKALASWVLAQAGVQPLIAGLPESVRVTTARARTGQRLWFFTNWSWDARALHDLPFAGRELFDDTPVAAGEPFHIGPWDVKIVAEDA